MRKRLKIKNNLKKKKIEVLNFCVYLNFKTFKVFEVSYKQFAIHPYIPGVRDESNQKLISQVISQVKAKTSNNILTNSCFICEFPLCLNFQRWFIIPGPLLHKFLLVFNHAVSQNVFILTWLFSSPIEVTRRMFLFIQWQCMPRNHYLNFKL